ncbi:MAG TPA: hypothetical protein VGF13_20645 [Verrucomicrobiae bacterium]|jgi:hypothetical protein
MGLFANIISLIANGTTADEEQERADSLDAALEDVQRTREDERPDLFATEDYQRQFNDHLATQREQDRDIAGQLEDEFSAGLGVQLDTGGKYLKWVLIGACIVAVLYLFGPALRKKFASA